MCLALAGVAKPTQMTRTEIHKVVTTIIPWELPFVFIAIWVHVGSPYLCYSIVFCRRFLVEGERKWEIGRDRRRDTKCYYTICETSSEQVLLFDVRNLNLDSHLVKSALLSERALGT